MLKDGIDATSAAYEVGYESVSQFNREYSRFFGQPPTRGVKALREGKVVAIAAAQALRSILLLGVKSRRQHIHASVSNSIA